MIPNAAHRLNSVYLTDHTSANTQRTCRSVLKCTQLTLKHCLRRRERILPTRKLKLPVRPWITREYDVIKSVEDNSDGEVFRAG